MCNDGWVNSSVYYSEVEECKTQCNYPSLPYCDLDQIKRDEQSALGSSRAVSARGGFLGSDFGESNNTSISSQYEAEYAACKSQWRAYESGLLNYEKCIDQSYDQQSVPSNDESSIEARALELCRTMNGPRSVVNWSEFNLTNSNSCSPTIDELHTQCQNIDSNMLYNKTNDECFCVNNYIYDSSVKECINPNDYKRKLLLDAFQETIEQMPEYQGVANPEIIVTIALSSANAGKTMREIIIQTYPEVKASEVSEVIEPSPVLMQPPAVFKETLQEVPMEKSVDVEPTVSTTESTDVEENEFNWFSEEDSASNTEGEVNVEEKSARNEPNVFIKAWRFLTSWF